MKKENKFSLATIYLDESGNTGTDLLSTNDPFFVYAWVLLTKDQEDSIEQQISDLLKKENLPISTELRSVNMWRSSRGCHRMDKVLRIVHNAGGNIFITFSEKLFEVCIFIIETYMDDLQNPTVTGQFRDIEYRRRLAHAIRNSISRDLLQVFLKACNTDDVEGLKSFGKRLAKMLVLHPDSQISAAAEVIEAGIENVYRFGKRDENTNGNVHSTTSHVAVFSLPLLHLDEKLDQFQLKAKLIRDQDFQFGTSLDLAYNMILKKELDIKNVVSVEEGLSSQQRGLQLADLAAGITLRVLRARLSNQSLKPYQWSIWKSLLGSLPFGKWTYQLTSDECEVKLTSLWKDIPDKSWYKTQQDDSVDNPLRCSCGQIIPSRNLRDFYLHVLECHPEAILWVLTAASVNKYFPLVWPLAMRFLNIILILLLMEQPTEIWKKIMKY